jgi:hypothetical protein
VEGVWLPTDELPDATKGMVEYAANVYLPFLAANAAAISNGKERFAVDLLGHRYEQGVFKYQVKCLDELQKRFKTLSESVRNNVIELLGETGLAALNHGA